MADLVLLGGAELEGVLPLPPQFPKAGLQELPQYALVEPHQPDDEQQLPKVLPRQVYLLVPPQVASGDTLFEGCGLGVGVGVGLIVVLLEDGCWLPLQVPNAD